MTPPDLPLDDDTIDDDDLAVHAVVDDEATAEQRRRVARDPELVARVAALRDVVAAVAEPVEPPPADVLAEIRRRALDDGTEVADVPTGDEPDTEAPTADEPVLPVRDLAPARARRTRSLPPLPAVAAVVVLLVVVGVGLLVAGTAGDGESSADRSAAEAGDAGGEQETAGGDDSGGGEEAPSAADSDESLTEGTVTEDGPSEALRDDLLARSSARYATQGDLEADLRRVDVGTLALAGSSAEAAGPDDGAASTTTAPPATTTASDEELAAAFASDPVATRCDDVLRAAEPDLDPAVGAVLVEVDGVPVLVLSNPTEISDRAPNGIRLTVLNAIDCSPRAAVLR